MPWAIPGYLTLREPETVYGSSQIVIWNLIPGLGGFFLNNERRIVCPTYTEKCDRNYHLLLVRIKNYGVGITIKLCETTLWEWNFQHKKPYLKKQKH